MLWSDLPQHKSVSSARGLLFPVFLLLWEGQIATERKVGGWEGLPFWSAKSLGLWSVIGGRTHRNVHACDQISQWGQDPICQCTGNGIHLSNLLRRSSNCTDIAVFVIWGGLPNWFSWYGIIAADKWATAEGTSNVFLLLSFSSFQTRNALKSMAASSILTL